MTIRIGAVNIDTSHPLAFGQVLERTGRARYVGVYNDSFRPDEEVEGFVGRFGLERRCATLEELAEMSDVGFVHGCDWDDHLRCMLPFLRAGKPVFVDKPLVGNLTDCRRVEELVRGGAVILGSSSVRYAYEIQNFLAIPAEERGEIVQVNGTAGVDEFNYGIHIVEAIGGVLGTGAERVRWAGRGQAGGKVSDHYHVEFTGGPCATFTTFTGTWQPFVLTILTTKRTYHFEMDANRLYEALLAEVCDALEGKPNRLAPAEAILESVRILLAAMASRAQGGAPVRLCDLTEEGPCYDGRRFWEGYGAAAAKMY